MSTLEEIKEQYAKENKFNDFNDFEYNAVHFEFCEAINEIAKRFTSQKVKEALERAAEKANYDAEYFSNPVNQTQLGRKIEAEQLRESILSLIKEY